MTRARSWKSIVQSFDPDHGRTKDDAYRFGERVFKTSVRDPYAVSFDSPTVSAGGTWTIDRAVTNISYFDIF